MRRALAITALLSLLAACGPSEAVCQSCPDISGVYTLVFQNDNSTGSCAGFNTGGSSTVVAFQQQGATLGVTLLGVPLQGSLFASGRLTLNGTSLPSATETRSLTLQGTHTEPTPGGSRITGNVEGDLSSTPTGGQASAECQLLRDFVGER
jgi:hypothetical protein